MSNHEVIYVAAIIINTSSLLIRSLQVRAMVLYLLRAHTLATVTAEWEPF